MKTLVETFFSRDTNLLMLTLVLAACLLGGCTSMMPAARTSTTNAVKLEISPLDYYAWATAAPENDVLVELYGLDLTISTTDPIISAVRKGIILSASELADTRSQSQAASAFADTKSGRARRPTRAVASETAPPQLPRRDSSSAGKMQSSES